MVPAPEEANLAIFAELRIHLNPQHRAPVVGVADLGMRELGEIRDLEDPVERLDQIAIVAFELGGLDYGVLRRMGVEIVIVGAQALEHFEIFVVIDRCQHFAEPPEFLAAGRVAESMLLRQRQQKIRPAEREIAIACV